MSWLLVPLQYLFCVWLAERQIARAAEAAGTQAHRRALTRAISGLVDVEMLQKRFPDVTDWVDAKRSRDAMRAHISA